MPLSPPPATSTSTTTTGDTMSPPTTLTVLEQCKVAPPPGTVAGATIPLTFLDLPHLYDPVIHHVFFHGIPDMTLTHFKDTIMPSLKHSLSLTLKHYSPLAGNLLLPPTPGEPYFVYAEGNSVPVTFAVTDADFDHLSGNHSRNVVEFHALLPRLPPVADDSVKGERVAALMAVQVTAFPSFGISIGFVFRRVAGDGRALTGFISSWASVSRSGGDAALVMSGALPIYDRSLIRDSRGLGPIFRAQMGYRNFHGHENQLKPTDNVIATFVMGHSEAQILKKRALARCRHVSTFTVVCGYMWSSIVKAREYSLEKESEQSNLMETDHFSFLADIRALLDPPVPDLYFGNCVARCIATARSDELTGVDGFVVAAKAVENAIMETLRNEEGDVLKTAAEKWVLGYKALKRDRVIGIAGSPRFAVYKMDFGWGKPKKSEVISIDVTGSMSLNESRDAAAGFEVGLAFPKAKMEAFATIFNTGLKHLSA